MEIIQREEPSLDEKLAKPVFWGKVAGLTVQELQPDMFDECLRLIQKYLIPEEAMCVALDLQADRAGRRSLLEHAKHCMRDGTSIVVLKGDDYEEEENEGQEGDTEGEKENEGEVKGNEMDGAVEDKINEEGSEDEENEVKKIKSGEIRRESKKELDEKINVEKDNESGVGTEVDENAGQMEEDLQKTEDKEEKKRKKKKRRKRCADGGEAVERTDQGERREKRERKKMLENQGNKKEEMAELGVEEQVERADVTEGQSEHGIKDGVEGHDDDGEDGVDEEVEEGEQRAVAVMVARVVQRLEHMRSFSRVKVVEGDAYAKWFALRCHLQRTANLFDEHDVDKYYRLYHIVVHPDHRKKGVASFLVQLAAQRLTALFAGPATLCTAVAPSRNAQRLLARQGFQPKVVVNYHEWKDERGEAVIRDAGVGNYSVALAVYELPKRSEDETTEAVDVSPLVVEAEEAVAEPPPPSRFPGRDLGLARPPHSVCSTAAPEDAPWTTLHYRPPFAAAQRPTSAPRSPRSPR